MSCFNISNSVPCSNSNINTAVLGTRAKTIYIPKVAILDVTLYNNLKKKKCFSIWDLIKTSYLVINL